MAAHGPKCRRKPWRRWGGLFGRFEYCSDLAIVFASKPAPTLDCGEPMFVATQQIQCGSGLAREEVDSDNDQREVYRPPPKSTNVPVANEPLSDRHQIIEIGRA